MKQQVVDKEDQYEMEVSNAKEMKTKFETDIASLNHDLEKQHEQMEEMEERMTSQSVLIESLNHKIAVNQESEKEMKEQLEEKNREIEVLQANLIRNQKQLEERIEELAKQKEMIVSLTLNESSSDVPSQETPIPDDSSINVSHDSRHSVETKPTSLLRRYYLVIN